MLRNRSERTNAASTFRAHKSPPYAHRRKYWTCPFSFASYEGMQRVATAPVDLTRAQTSEAPWLTGASQTCDSLAIHPEAIGPINLRALFLRSDRREDVSRGHQMGNVAEEALLEFFCSMMQKIRGIECMTAREESWCGSLQGPTRLGLDGESAA